MLPRAFISYSHRDDKFVRFLADELDRHGIRNWRDRRRLVIGSRFGERIMSAIAECDVFLPVLSESSTQSKWVRKELDYALKLHDAARRPRIMPVLLDSCTIPAAIADLNYADFRSEVSSPLRILVASIVGEESEREPYRSSAVVGAPYIDTRDREAARIYNAGVRAYQAGDLEHALRYFDAAVALDPQQFDAAYNAAVVAYDLAGHEPNVKELMRSVAERYERVLELRSSDVDAMVNLAVVYNTQAEFGNLERAAELLKRAVSLAPDYALAWLNLGHNFVFRSGFERVMHEGAVSKEFLELRFDAALLTGAASSFQRAFKLDSTLELQFPATVRMKTLLEGWLSR